MTSRTFVLRTLPILIFSSVQDKLIPVLTEDKQPALFSYKLNLFNLLRSSPQGKNKKIKDVLRIEELVARLMLIKQGDPIMLNDSEYLLIKEAFEEQEYPGSSSELQTMYLDLVNAPVLQEYVEAGEAKKE